MTRRGQRSKTIGSIDASTPEAEDHPQILVIGGADLAEGEAWRGPELRWMLVTAAATLVVVAAIATAATIMRREAAPTIRDFTGDTSLVGEALTAGFDSGDADVFLSLFSDDARLEFSGAPGLFEGETITLARYRDFMSGWSRVMNERWEWVDCQSTGSAPDGPIACEVRVTNDWLDLMGEEPDRGRVTLQVVEGEITHWDHRGLRSPNDLTVARFEDWTRANRPGDAALMWQDEGSIFPIFSEESARLHLRLGEEYLREIS